MEDKGTGGLGTCFAEEALGVCLWVRGKTGVPLPLGLSLQWPPLARGQSSSSSSLLRLETFLSEGALAGA